MKNISKDIKSWLLCIFYKATANKRLRLKCTYIIYYVFPYFTTNMYSCLFTLICIPLSQVVFLDILFWREVPNLCDLCYVERHLWQFSRPLTGPQQPQYFHFPQADGRSSNLSEYQVNSASVSALVTVLQNDLHRGLLRPLQIIWPTSV